MDAERFKSLYFGFHPKLYQVAFALTGSAADAEDILQEVYAKLWKKREALAGILNPEAFAVTMTRRASLDFLRSPAGRKNRTAIDRLDEFPGDDPPDARVEARDRLHEVQGWIDRLPDNQRQILRLAALGDSSDEIAGQTGLTPGNVRTLLSRARKTIRQQMKNQYSDE